MHERKGFTLIELLVVISIIALLLSILMPALQRVKKQARSIACQANLHHWGPIFSMYLDDYEGKFSEFSSDAEHIWIESMRPYYTDQDICLCPTTLKSWMDGVVGTFVAWDWRAYESDIPDEMYEYYAGAYGSYGKNSWLSQNDWDGRGDLCWRNIYDVQDRANVPLLLDCNFLGGFPQPFDEPPPHDGYFDMVFAEITRYCLNRHDGYINSLFADFSIRKVGLKELWTLKWHREFDTNGPWTSPHVRAADWPEWIKSFKDY